LDDVGYVEGGEQMPVDSEKYWSPATRGDVAGIALSAASALLHVKWALEKIKAGDRDIERHIENIDTEIDDLNKRFDELTGYIDDDT
jgi:hypothetical protein